VLTLEPLQFTLRFFGLRISSSRVMRIGAGQLRTTRVQAALQLTHVRAKTLNVDSRGRRLLRRDVSCLHHAHYILIEAQRSKEQPQRSAAPRGQCAIAVDESAWIARARDARPHRKFACAALQLIYNVPWCRQLHIPSRRASALESTVERLRADVRELQRSCTRVVRELAAADAHITRSRKDSKLKKRSVN